MAWFERTRLDNNLRTAYTTTVLTYVSTANEIGSDPLGLKTLPLNGSLVTGRELSLRLGRKVQGTKDSLWWVELGPQAEIKTYKPIAPDLSDFRSRLSAQLKKWGKDNAIKRIMTVRAINAGVVAAITTMVVVAVVVSVASGGLAAPEAIGKTVSYGSKLAKWAATGGPEKLYNTFSPAAQAMAKTAASGGSLEDMAASGNKALPVSVKADVSRVAKQSTQATQQETVSTLTPTQIGIGLGLGGIAIASGIVLYRSRK